MKPDTIKQHQSRWTKAVEGREAWTREAWIDLRVEANKAWTPEEMEIARAQNRNLSNYALVRPVIEVTCGLEAQTRSDLKIMPRTRQHMDSAEALTSLAKYIDDQNKTARHRSMSFKDAAKIGVGWLEVAYNSDIRKERIMKRRENPFNVWTDPTMKELDMSDALDIFRAKFLYPSYLCMMFPWLKGEIPGTTGSSYDPMSHTADYTNREGDRPSVGEMNNLGNTSGMYGPGHGIEAPFSTEMYYSQHLGGLGNFDRYDGLVQVVERWYRQDEMALFARLQNGVVLENTPENRPIIARAVVRGEARLAQSIARRVRCAMFVDDILLQDVESPYSHGEFPFVPTWAYQDEDGVPMGLVRILRDPARDFNARNAHLIKRSTMRQVHYEDGAFVDEDEAIRELAKFNGAVRYTEGALSSGKVQIKDNLQASQVDFELMNNSANMVQNMSGVPAETLGQETNAKSGRAIEARQRQGQTSLYTLFDNRNWAQVHEGELTLSLIQDAYTEEEEIRITDSKRGLDFIHINKRDPESGAILNDITQGRYDHVVSQQPETAVDRQAKLQTLTDFLSMADPALRMIFAPQIAELSDLPEDFVEQVQQYITTAMQGPAPQDPNAIPPEAMPPEEMAPEGAPPLM